MGLMTHEMTLTDAARYANVSYRTLQRWISKGRVKSRLFHGRRYIDTTTLPGCRMTLAGDKVSHKALTELLQVIQSLIDMQPVSDIKSINRRRELRAQVDALLVRLNDAD
ncbi:helix-turn-helix domain-containing protein [Marinobacter sp.]|uniref:helix-turn-helix domain-containing protein n=1 Tax=Marinobacter sp. TaxID=50741 RepID=UPI00261D7C50|nr:helix-turn-helix domain-containing protein [Marinobacter sp.]